MDIKDQVNDLNGLRGWLILVGVSLLLTPIRMLYEIVTVYPPLFSDGTFEALTSPVSVHYNEFFGPLIITEIVMSVLFFIGFCYLLFLFSTKHYRFPKLFIFIVVGHFLFIAGDTYVVTLVFPDVEVLDEEMIRELIKMSIYAAIWVPYMLLSKRVEATFVKGQNTELESQSHSETSEQQEATL